MMHEVSEAANVVAKAADPDANIIFGAVIDPRMQGEVRITVIATGFNGRVSNVLNKVRPIRVRDSEWLAESDVELPTFLRREAKRRGNESAS
jgi:cell division protein FtsZ